jgi:hypothetical protein
MTLAVLLDAVAISVIAILGGFLTPILLSTGTGARDPLFAYLLLLDLGVLGIAFFKRWRPLDVLGFVGTWALFTGWFLTYYSTPQLVATMLWLGAFYIVFLVLPFVYHLAGLKAITGERFVITILNAAVFFAYSYRILHADHELVLAGVSSGMSACYLIMAVLTRVRLPDDRRAFHSLAALSMMFATLAVPLYLDLYAVAIAWAVEAVILLYLGFRYDWFPARVAGFAALVLSVVWFSHMPWAVRPVPFVPVFNRPFGSAFFITLAGMAYAVVHHLNRKKSQDTDGILQVVTAIGMGIFMAVASHVEIWHWLGSLNLRHLTSSYGALLWATASLVYCLLGIRFRSHAARATGTTLAAVSAVFVVISYLRGQPADWMFLNVRCLAGLGVVLVLAAHAFVLRRFSKLLELSELKSTVTLYGFAILAAGCLLSVESWLWFRAYGLMYTCRCVLALLWSGTSVAFLFSGFALK